MSHVEIRPVTGFAVEPWLDELEELRIEVFRDFPYLYQGNREYERRYLDRYAQSDRSVFVLALEFNRLVGAATALPLLEADDEFQAPFRQLGAELGSVFYFGESVLLKPYRGEGVGHRFFDVGLHRLLAAFDLRLNGKDAIFDLLDFRLRFDDLLAESAHLARHHSFQVDFSDQCQNSGFKHSVRKPDVLSTRLA